MLKPILKYFLVCLLILVWLASPFYGLFFQFQQKNLRQQMKQRLETEIGLVAIKIPAHSIHWVRPGREIVFEGRMFDIKTLEQMGDTAFITGLYDEEEQWLHQKLAQQMGKEKDAQSQKIIRLIHLFAAFSFVEAFQSPNFFQNQIPAFPAYNAALQKGFPRLLTPPPCFS